MSTFRIVKINTNGSVDVSFSCDNKVQNISDLPIDNAEMLGKALSEYGKAYEAGLATEPNNASPEVQGLIGQVKNVE